MAKKMDMEYYLFMRESSKETDMKGSGVKEYMKEKEFIIGLMGVGMKVNGKTIIKVGMEFFIGLVEINMKVSGKITWQTGKELTIG